MNRNYTLIFSAIIVVTLLVVLVYILFFDSTKDTESDTVVGSGSFAEFVGLGDDAPNQPTTDGEGDLSNRDGREIDPNSFSTLILRQLTDRVVVGYQEVIFGDTPVVYIMESGVGHLYAVDAITGTEERVSATTIPNAREAIFSTNMEYVAVRTGESTGASTLQLGTVRLREGMIALETITEEVVDFSITSDGYLIYSTPTNNSLVVRYRKLDTGETKTLFTIPFREATVLFGTTLDASHFFYPKTSHLLEGFVYEYRAGNLHRLPIDGFGLSAVTLGDTLVVTRHKETTVPKTLLYDIATQKITTIDTVVLPEKCSHLQTRLYCGVADESPPKYDSVHKWLQGTILFTDSLWQIGEGEQKILDIFSFSQENIDIILPMISSNSTNWYFSNKRDNSLWMYELSHTSTVNDTTL